MNFLKKTCAVCMVGFGMRCFASFITSNYRMGIWNWSDTINIGISMALQIILMFK